MVIFHQLKSAGTSLVYSLSRDLGVGTWIDSTNPKTRKSIKNCRGRELFRELKKFESPHSIVASFHLHPTREVLDFIKTSRLRALVLLRNPIASRQAMDRHREIDNSFKGANQAYKGNDALLVLEEFNRNYRTLVDADHLLFVSFEDVVYDYRAVFHRVARFYDLNRVSVAGDLEKKRFSGEGIKDSLGRTDLSKTSSPTFRFNPNFEYDQYLRRKIFTFAPFLPTKWVCYVVWVIIRISSSRRKI